MSTDREFVKDEIFFYGCFMVVITFNAKSMADSSALNTGAPFGSLLFNFLWMAVHSTLSPFFDPFV